MSDKPSAEDDKEDQPRASAINSPIDSQARVDIDSDNDKRNRKRRHTRNDAGATRHRPPTPYPPSALVHKPLRGHHSLEVTKLQPDVHSLNKNGNSNSNAKSVSMDAMTRKGHSQESSTNNNNSLGGPVTKESWLFKKGRLFRSNKVTPAGLEEVITVAPVGCLSRDCHHMSCVRSQQMGGESCHPVDQTKSTDSMENICRICHDSPSAEKLIAPCLCKGSMGRVHRTCLERWLGESGKSSCEICGQEYNTVRIPKYKGLRSVIAWIRNPLTPGDTRNFFFDVACFFILTPLACLSAWLCVLGAQHYSLEEHKIGRRHEINETLEARANRDASNSTWTSVGLLSLTGTLVAAYYIWIFVAVRYHLQVWREWQQRNYIVTIVPLANGDFSRSPAPPATSGDDHTDQDDNDSDSSDPPVHRRENPRGAHESWEVRLDRLRNQVEDRNNNDNSNRRNPNQSSICGINNVRNTTNFILSNRRRMVEDNVIQQRSSSTSTVPTQIVSKTLLFYQKIFGNISNEHLTDEDMVQLALLQSAAEANISAMAASEDNSAGPSSSNEKKNNVISVIHFGKDGLVRNASSNLKTSEATDVLDEETPDHDFHDNDNNLIKVASVTGGLNAKLHNVIEERQLEEDSQTDSNPDDTTITFVSDDIGRGGNYCSRDYNPNFLQCKEDLEYDICEDFPYRTESTPSINEICETLQNNIDDDNETSTSSRTYKHQRERQNR